MPIITRAETIEDFKAVSMNVLHSSMEITDQFYSNLSDADVKTRIDALRHDDGEISWETDELEQYRQFLAWRKAHKKMGGDKH